MDIHGPEGIKVVFSRLILFSVHRGSTLFRRGCSASVSVPTSLHPSWSLGQRGIWAAPGYLGSMLQNHHSGTFHLDLRVSFHPWLSSIFFSHCFCHIKDQDIQKGDKRGRNKTPFGTHWDHGMGSLLVPFIDKRTTKPVGSPDAGCFLISFCGLSTYLTSFRIYGK